ncbi:predicted protein [Histoplasma capsulatum var. duboisii H88]|uniref:Predicted protein n=1 Tax=Ajellomyces capsulatus (strain H88) TaxID=544711 RepID=F0UID4_AJEC8|nr:predicted protein [Histoplasma capsulatum var. duboisii H88]
MDQMLHDRKKQYIRAKIVIDKFIKEGKPIPVNREEYLEAMKVCDRIAQIYYRILDCPACYFQAEDSIIKDDFTVTNAEPVFFSQMPLADLREYTFEPFEPLEPLDPIDRLRGYGDEEYISVVDIEISNLLSTTSKETPKYEILRQHGNWHNERAAQNIRMPLELVKSRSPERYEWRTPFIWGQKDLPHTVILSFQATSSPAPIMRGELLSILSVTWWKNKVIIGKGHKLIPSEEQDVEYDFPSYPSRIHSQRQFSDR